MHCSGVGSLGTGHGYALSMGSGVGSLGTDHIDPNDHIFFTHSASLLSTVLIGTKNRVLLVAGVPPPLAPGRGGLGGRGRLQSVEPILPRPGLQTCCTLESRCQEDSRTLLYIHGAKWHFVTMSGSHTTNHHLEDRRI